MKPKRLLALLMAVVTVVSVFTISASAANTEDTYYTYSWKSNSRYDYTPTRKKMNATPVSQIGKYVRIRGHYSDTTYSWGDCKIAWSPDTTNASNYTYLN